MAEVLTEKLMKLVEKEQTEEKDSEEALINRTQSYRDIIRSESKIMTKTSSKTDIKEEKPNFILIGYEKPNSQNYCRDLAVMVEQERGKQKASDTNCKDFTLLGKIRIDERNYSRELIIRNNNSGIFDLNIKVPHNSVCIDDSNPSPYFPAVPPNSAAFQKEINSQN